MPGFKKSSFYLSILFLAYFAFFEFGLVKAMSDGQFSVDGAFGNMGSYSSDGQFMVVPLGIKAWGSADFVGCDGNNLNLCAAENDCVSFGGYWYGNVCNVNAQSQGAAFIAPPPPKVSSFSVLNASIGSGTIDKPYVVKNNKVSFGFSTNASFIAVSETEDFAGGSWMPLPDENKIDWELQRKNGVHVLYLKFRTQKGGVSDVIKVYFDLDSESQINNNPDNSNNNFVFKSFLNLGYSGEEVRQLQLKLKDLGFFNYPTATGYYGNVTKDAVRKFQAANGIDSVGYVGPGTRAALNK